MSPPVAIVVIATVVRLVIALFIPLFPDEAYYWEWSRHLAAGYFDHPYGIALLIRGGTALLGRLSAATPELSVRLLPVLAGGVGSLAVVATAQRLASARAALLAAVAVTCVPLAAAGLVLATPDAPLLATTAVSLYFVVRAVQAPTPATAQSREALYCWAAAGVALGLAFSSKYTSIVLPLGVAVAVLARPSLRLRLREAGPWVACILATLCFVPVLQWNASHGWISFGFQLQHGLAAARGTPLQRELELVGGQAGLASPILFVLMCVAVWRALQAGPATRERDAAWILGVVAIECFGLFAVSALRRSVEANWPAPSYIPALALVAATTWSTSMARWLRAGFWLAGVLSGLVYLQAVTGILPIPARRDPVARADGWTALALAADSAKRVIASQEPAGTSVWLAADRYQDAAEMAFYAPGQPVTFSVNLSGRANEYDVWPGFPALAHTGDDLVLALDDTPQLHSSARALTPFFESAQPGALVSLRRRQDLITSRRLWIFRHWRGGWPRSSVSVP